MTQVRCIKMLTGMAFLLVILFSFLTGCAGLRGNRQNVPELFDKQLNDIVIRRSDAYMRVIHVKSDSTLSQQQIDYCQKKYESARLAVNKYINKLLNDFTSNTDPDTNVYNSMAGVADLATNVFIETCDNLLGIHSLSGSTETFSLAQALIGLIRPLFGGDKSNIDFAYMRQRTEEARWDPFDEL